MSAKKSVEEVPGSSRPTESGGPSRRSGSRGRVGSSSRGGDHRWWGWRRGATKLRKPQLGQKKSRRESPLLARRRLAALSSSSSPLQPRILYHPYSPAMSTASKAVASAGSSMASSSSSGQRPLPSAKRMIYEILRSLPADARPTTTDLYRLVHERYPLPAGNKDDPLTPQLLGLDWPKGMKLKAPRPGMERTAPAAHPIGSKQYVPPEQTRARRLCLSVNVPEGSTRARSLASPASFPQPDQAAPGRSSQAAQEPASSPAGL
jgi:hypothetical protein